jgi:nucleotide-binding universal stress UspA family protein
MTVIDENEVTLLVMGAYTRGRVRQMLFGGITQKVLSGPGVPALLAH